MAITTHEHSGQRDHGHDHEGAVGPHTHLTSVGIDIGSSTSHLMFSRLLIGYPSVLQRKPIVLERNVIARSPILLTPFSGDWNIEAGPLRQLVDATFNEAELTRADIDTGAVIITGEAARRECQRWTDTGNHHGGARLGRGAAKPRAGTHATEY
ncbi:MAG: eutA [Deltaproteobacteria bacterium]|nr:eutA [Deltaproteobacteria bacterium]